MRTFFDKMKQRLASVTESTSKSMDIEKKLLDYKEKQRLELLAYEQSLLKENTCVIEEKVTSQQKLIASSDEHSEYIIIKDTLEYTSASNEVVDNPTGYLEVVGSNQTYDELPNLENIPASEILQSLLKGSIDTKKELEFYIKDNHKKVIPYRQDFVSYENFYILDNKIYFFNKDQWIKITQILSECKNLDCLERTLKKSSVIKDIKEQVLECIISVNQEEDNTIYKKIIQGLNLDMTVQAILKTLNYQIVSHYSDKDKRHKELSLNFTYTIQHLGNLLGGMYLEKYFYEIAEFTKESDSKDKPIYVPKQIDENILKEFLHKINDSTITIEDYSVQVKSSIHDYAFNKFISLLEDKKVLDYLNASIYINELESIENPLLDIEALTLLRDTFNLNLGVVLINEMLNQQLLSKKLMPKEEDNKKEWQLILGESLESQINASAVFYKPRLVDFKIDTSSLHTLDKLELKVSVKDKLVKQSSDVKLTLKDAGKVVLEIQSPMMIAREQFLSFIEYTLYILDKDFNIKDEEILTYLQIIYNIDFRVIVENTTHRDLLEIVMKYGLDLDSNYKMSLGKQCEISPSIFAIYNKICSYKYHLKCMLNDCNLYRQFNYFYLDRFATSTMRQFTKVYSLNLQGAKIVRSFVICAKLSHNKVTKDNFPKYMEIVKEQISTTEALKYLDKLKYTDYNQLRLNTYEGYCNHFIKAEYSYKDFPLEAEYLQQITWLSSRVKKPRDILLAQLILSSKNIEHILIEQDATSSGVQLTSILLRIPEVAILSNILANMYTDLYSMHYKEYHDDIIEAKEFVLTVLEHIGLPSLNDLLDMDKVSISEVKGLGQLLEYVIYGKEEDMPTVIQTLLKTLNSVMETGTLKAMNLVYPKNANWLPDSALVNLMMQSLPVKGDKVTYLIRCLLNVRQVYKYEACLRKNPWIVSTKALESRQLSKLPIMAYAYGLGARGRKADFLEYMEETALDNGFDNIDFESLELLASTMERYFLKFEFKYINQLRTYVDIVSNYVKECGFNNKPMYFDNKYSMSHYKPHFIKVSRPRVRTNTSIEDGKSITKITRLSLYQKSHDIDYLKAKSTLCSIFVHSADAWIVYRFNEKLNAMNKKLYENKLPLISSFTNQDNFATNIHLAMFLKLLVADCYNEFSNINYIQQLYSLVSKDIFDDIYDRELIKVLNSNFIRH